MPRPLVSFFAAAVLAATAHSARAQTPGRPLLPPAVPDSLIHDSTQVAAVIPHRGLVCSMPVMQPGAASEPMPVAQGNSDAGDSMPVMPGNCSTSMPLRVLTRP
ncbi:MAG TPA: hypothetical protein VFL95_09560 [Gemmatimonadales bacterium]|nr:hypothetical protein [Gemmatimonadales bacterium]